MDFFKKCFALCRVIPSFFLLLFSQYQALHLCEAFVPWDYQILNSAKYYSYSNSYYIKQKED